MSLTTSRAYMRHRRARLISAGLCVGCGEVPPAPGRRRCAPCLQKESRRVVAKDRHRSPILLALGICPKCRTRQVISGLKSCGVCAEYFTAAKANLRARWRAAGLCIWCGRERERQDRVLCDTCRAKQSAAHHRRIAKKQEAA